MEERRRDDATIAVLVTRFNDFLDSTDKYRKGQEDIQSMLARDLKETTGKIFDELGAIKIQLSKLPCPERKSVADKVHEGFEKDSRYQWIMIGFIWVVIGGVALSCFEAWLRLWGR